MLACLPDGTLLVADAFGLTRVNPKGRAKTDDKVYASPARPLSVGGAEAWVHILGPYSYQSKLLAVASLKPAAKLASAVTAVLPDGARALLGATVCDLDGNALAPLPLDDAPMAPALSPNADDGTPHVIAPAIRADGRAVVAWWVDGVLGLASADLSGATPAVRWRAPLRGGREVVHVPSPTRDGVTDAAWYPRTGDCVLFRRDARGQPAGEHHTRSLSQPALGEDHALVQPSPERLAVIDLATGAERAIDLAATGAKDVVGVGRCLADGGRLFFLPWHAERLLDLDRGVEIDRALPAAQARQRAAFRAWMRDEREALLGYGYVDASMFRAAARGYVTLWAPLPSMDGDGLKHLAKLAEHLRTQASLTLGAWGAEG